jgi:hypothetical protein
MVFNIEDDATGATIKLSINAFTAPWTKAEALEHVLGVLYTPVEFHNDLPATAEIYIQLSQRVCVRIFESVGGHSTIYVEAPLDANQLNGRVITNIQRLPGVTRVKIAEPKKRKATRRRESASIKPMVATLLSSPDLSGKVLLCDEAVKGLDGVFFHRDEDLKALLTQLGAAASTFNEGLDLGTDVNTFFKTKLRMKGFTRFLSDTQTCHFGEDYTGTYQGATYLGEWHCTLFDGTNTLSAHFVYAPEHQAIVITRLGAHGRTQQDRT